MGSLLNSASSSLALQTLRTVQKQLTKTQAEMTTGKKVSDARDGAATWAKANTISSDRSRISSIVSGLQETKAAVDIAITAANNIVSKITTIGTQVASYTPGDAAQLSTINAAINSAAAQIDSYATTTYNGLNLLNNTTSNNVTSGLTRSSANVVTTQTIAVAGVGLHRTAGASVNGIDIASSGSAGGAKSGTIAATAGSTLVLNVQSAAAASGVVTSMTIGDKTVSYTAGAGVTEGTVASALKSSFESLGVSGISFTLSAGDLSVVNDTGSAVNVAVTTNSASSGALAGLTGTLDASTLSSGTVSTALTSAQTNAGVLGNLSNRLSSQIDFLNSIGDHMDSSVSELTDADMESTAARLQALQVQQQLAVQSLAISNSNNQVVLQLFK